MRHHRFKHAADVFCRMFGGWRLANSFARIEHLGSGELVIDVLSGECRWNGVRVDPVPIAYELQIWFQQDLQAHCIDPTTVRLAQLRAVLQLEAADVKSAKSFFIDEDNKPIRKGDFVRLVARCHSQIVTDEKAYSIEHTFSESWPKGWPSTNDDQQSR